MSKIFVIIFVLFSLTYLPSVTFAVDSTKCPEGYICLKKDDPLVLASTTCLINSNQQTTIYTNINPKAISKGDDIVFYLKNKDRDYAGIWNIFGSGSGSSNYKKNDWGFESRINLIKPKIVKSITIINMSGNEGWSTSADERLFGKKPYPLVVLNNLGKQLNYKYEETISLPKGETELNLYGQIEFEELIDTEIVIIFTDNTYISKRISDNASTSVKNELHQSFWSSMKKALGF